jgi:hypothetical protein
VSKVNTVISYSLRSVIAIHASFIGVLFARQSPSNPVSSTIPYLMVGLPIFVALLLVADWTTQKDASRRFSKLIDSFLGIAWILAIGAALIYSLSMGTL